MNEYRCDDCGWIYRPEDHGGLHIDDQDEGWVCDECQAGRDHFQLVVPPDDDVATAEDEASASPARELTAGRIIYVRTSEPDVSTLKKRYDKGRLDVRPDFQRYDVWTTQKKSRLIESVLLDLPIPRIYFAQQPDNSEIVVDGQQRLLATFQFLDNKFALKNLGVYPRLNDRRFKELPDAVQETIDKFQFSVVTILKESDEDIKFDLFERLNTGSTQLNDQELRNSVYRGDYNNYLRELAMDPDWRRLLSLRGSEPHKRMADVELVLRFMAFYHQTYLKHPDKNTNQFLNQQMTVEPALSRGT